MSKNRLAVTIGLLSLLCAGTVSAVTQSGAADQGGPNFPGAKKGNTTAQVSPAEERKDARDTVRGAAKVVQKLKSDPDTRQTLSQARAVLIVPSYGRAALGIGGAGGEGVLAVNNNGNWSSPAFYNIGSVNLGLQAGVEGGQLAFFLMSDKALNEFSQDNNFSLNADAGLTVVNWNKRAQASVGKSPDVIAWTDTKGLYGDLAVGITDIYRDNDANQAYYGRKVAINDILHGSVQDPMNNSPLEAEFAALETSGNRNR